MCVCVCVCACVCMPCVRARYLPTPFLCFPDDHFKRWTVQCYLTTRYLTQIPLFQFLILARKRGNGRVVKALDSLSTGCRFESRFQQSLSSPLPTSPSRSLSLRLHVGLDSESSPWMTRRPGSLSYKHVHVNEPMAAKTTTISAAKSAATTTATLYWQRSVEVSPMFGIHLTSKVCTSER